MGQQGLPALVPQSLGIAVQAGPPACVSTTKHGRHQCCAYGMNSTRQPNVPCHRAWGPHLQAGRRRLPHWWPLNYPRPGRTTRTVAACDQSGSAETAPTMSYAAWSNTNNSCMGVPQLEAQCVSSTRGTCRAADWPAPGTQLWHCASALAPVWLPRPGGSLGHLNHPRGD